MKLRKIQTVLVLAVTFVAILFSSAGSVLNIKERIFVHALGIDPGENGEGYKITMQVFKPQGAGSDTPVDVLQSNIQVVQSEGNTVRQALSEAQNSLGREIFLGHLQVICLNKKTDFSSPENLFEFCLKDKNVFYGVKLCLCENKAEEIMQTQITRGTTTSESFVDTIKKSVVNSKAVDCELIDFLSCINSHINVAMPVLSVKKPDKKGQGESQSGQSGQTGQTGESSEQQTQESGIEIKKTALVKDGKVLETYLDEEETEGVAWFSRKGKISEFSVKNGENFVDIKLTRDKFHTKIRNENGNLVVKVEFTAVARSGEEVESKNQAKEISEKVKKRMEKVFRKSVEKALYENKTDVFGVWKMLRHSYPETYLEYKDNLDVIFENVKFDYKIKIRTA